MVKVKIFAGVCGFSTIVNAEDKGDYNASFKLESKCPNWKQVSGLFG